MSIERPKTSAYLKAKRKYERTIARAKLGDSKAIANLLRHADLLLREARAAR